MPQTDRRFGVLFDVDGTLVDSNYLHTISWWHAFRQLGRNVPMAAIHRAVGMGADKLIAHLLGEDRDKDQDSQAEDAHGAVFSTYWPALRAFDGAKDLLERCSGTGLTVVLASSSKRRELDVLTAAIGANEAVAGTTSSSDAQESKPAPDILAAALDAGGLQAADALFVGDAVWDVMAASELGIPTIGLTCGGTGEAELRDAGAIEIHEDPAALLAGFEASALGQLAARAADAGQPVKPDQNR
ncbi:HAD family hydrolase [Arthrobacter crystallopoietes]|uniref:HAD family hydrolase n=1 Tax=Crystallibacter crystallopoietes TaxID=37928 RepID=UPI0011112395|nr:HAD family hydrolase [Arthrobacter crystallopoietes]